jgi:general secretion pathway protein C
MLSSENSMEHMRRMISEQPSLLADVIHPQPVMDHGRMNGFRVYPGRNRMAFMRLGLRPGDQVTAINGTPLDDRDRGEQIMHTLSSASEARVTVIRNGQTQDLNLNIAQIAQEADGLATQSPAAQTGLVPPMDQPVATPPPPEPPGPDSGGQ